MLLRGKDGNVIATGCTLFEKTIHGHELHKDALIVAVDEVVQVGALNLGMKNPSVRNSVKV